VVMWLVGTATVTTQGLKAHATRRTKSGDFYLAKTGDSDLATSGDFFMATDSVPRKRPAHGNCGESDIKKPSVRTRRDA